jgi:hypothetical protein
MRKISLIFSMCIWLVACNQSKTKDVNNNQRLILVPKKEIMIDLGAEYPKLQGSPTFLNDGGRPYFYIQSAKGLGVFDLRQGGSAVDHFITSEVNGYIAAYDKSSTFITPLEGKRYLIYHQSGGEIYVVNKGQIEENFRIARFDPEIAFLMAGAYRQMDFKNGLFYGMFGLTEKYGRPPFKFVELDNFILSINTQNATSEKLFKLPENYLNQNFNVYDVLVSFVRKEDSDEFIINFPVTDEVYVTSDFVEFKKIKLSPGDGFVDISNRMGRNPAMWTKEYYMRNSFQAVYYDPYRKLLVRHYRKALSEPEFDRIYQLSPTMQDEAHENRLLFANLDGEILADIVVSSFNYWYIHFAEEGMYILNDKELVNEDQLTFTLFEIQMKD